MNCPYCKGEAKLVSGADIYISSRDEFLRAKPFWLCRPCNAWCGCHPGTTVALGTLANKPTREARMKAHAAFDALWQKKMERDKCSKSKARSAGYVWLAKELGIEPVRCHISLFDAAMALRVVEVCARVTQAKGQQMEMDL